MSKDEDDGNWLDSFVPSPYADAPKPPARREPDLVYGKSGNVPFNQNNSFEILCHDEVWEGTFAFDEFAQRKMVMKKIPGTSGNPVNFRPRELRDDDYLAVVRWFNRNGFPSATKTVACDAVDEACRQVVVSPVRFYLDEAYDTVKREPAQPEVLDMFLETYLGVIPESPEQRTYIRAVSRKWLLSAVARAMKPGCKADAVLIMEGTQGAGKSTALRYLAGDEWFGDALPHMGTKDASDYVRGKWIIELAELSNVNKAEVEVVKAFISRSEERFRPAYGRSEISYPRACVFAGTTNKADYLRDETGNRRFWPVKCGKIDTKGIKRDRDFIWGEAVRLFQTGEVWWLEGEAAKQAEVEQGSRLAVDEWVTQVEEYCAGKPDVTITEIAEEAFTMLPRDINRAVQNRISSILSTLGYARAGRSLERGPRRDKMVWVRENGGV